MSKKITVRNAPDSLHRKLKMRSAERGVSLSDYLLEEVRESAERLTLEEMLERLAALEPLNLGEDPALTIRRYRDAV